MEKTLFIIKIFQKNKKLIIGLFLLSIIICSSIYFVQWYRLYQIKKEGLKQLEQFTLANISADYNLVDIYTREFINTLSEEQKKLFNEDMDLKQKTEEIYKETIEKAKEKKACKEDFAVKNFIYSDWNYFILCLKKRTMMMKELSETKLLSDARRILETDNVITQMEKLALTDNEVADYIAKYRKMQFLCGE